MYKENLHAVIFPDYKYLSDNKIIDIQSYFRDFVLSPFNAVISPSKQIKQFTLVDQELPRTRLSKLQRFKLEELILNSVSKKVKLKDPDSAEYLSLKTFIESQVDMDISSGDHIVFDLGLDSLSKLSLIDFIEKTFGVKISEEELIKFPSVLAISDFINLNKLFFRHFKGTIL